VRTGDVGRIEDALGGIRRPIEREGADTTQALATVAGLLVETPRYRRAAARPDSGVPTSSLSRGWLMAAAAF